MVVSVVALGAGFVVLALASEHFVLGAARLAEHFRLSTVVIGAVVIGFGTSAPEMVVSGLAAGQGSLDIAVGNVIGSNVANLSLVLGAAALVTPIVVASPTMRREAPISFLAVLLFAVLVQSGLNRLEGAVLGITLAAVLWILIRNVSADDPEVSVEVEEYLGDRSGNFAVRTEYIRVLAGLIGTVAAAQLLVWAAMDLTDRIGLAEGFVGLTIIAIGTSLPELATSLQAARKDETDLIVGNLLGSNIFTSLAVGSIAGLVGSGSVEDASLTGTAVILMPVVTVLAIEAMRTKNRVDAWERLVLLAGYIAAIPLLA